MCLLVYLINTFINLYTGLIAAEMYEHWNPVYGLLYCLNRLIIIIHFTYLYAVKLRQYKCIIIYNMNDN